MKRRTLLTAFGCVAVGIPGCLAGESDEDHPPECPTTHTVSVVAVENVSGGESVYDAESDGFTEVETIAEALETADAVVEDGDAVDAYDLSYDSDDVLARNGTTTENNDVQDRLSEFPFVEYEDRTYHLAWEEVVC
ncbi:hypothetical protein [Natrarchaeobius oligotrophus]|uniref:Uncharacterized protein n=1 Tax=Natrarchaeobius chitinivorans TaxID=1679083 RepID=A0A3N6MH13_NATCH|nr:hypothetical protein [Natrarchaeobius chitinivorans]RQH03299.1 hypothetical protein EA472_01585 [Natrarchaeobius chitinivorans]